MADGKKSFILYCDQRGIFNKLSDEQAGVLIKHIFAYVSDENPEADFVTELAFESIKSQLKRDLKTWEVRQEQRREAGRKSAEARQQLIEDAQRNSTTVESRSTEINDRSISSTVNGNGNGNGNVNEKETKVSPEKSDNVRWVVSILNKEAGTSFKSEGKATCRLVNARIKEGFTGADFKAVIRHKVKQWAGDPEMAQYLRPSTLFGTKFESYLNAAKLEDVEKPRSRPADPKF